MIEGRERLALGIVALVAVSAACTVTRPSLERHSFALSAERPGQQAPAGNPKPFPVTLKVGRISVEPPYGGTSFIYRTGDLRYEADPYNGFFASPSELLGRQIALSLGGSGLFAAVREPASPLTGDYVLEGLLTELYADARRAEKPEAVLSLQLHVRRASAGGGLVFERAYSQRVAMDDVSPEALVRGYGLALGRLLEALERDLAALKLGP